MKIKQFFKNLLEHFSGKGQTKRHTYTHDMTPPYATLPVLNEESTGGNLTLRHAI
jgi:hypothetical protein